MKFEVGTRCWIPDEQNGWLGAIVRKVDYDSVTKKYRIELENDDNQDKVKYIVETGDLTESNKRLPQLRNIDDTVDDLTTLSHLNEPSVLNAVKLRYAKKNIYTFSGIVLIAINPFEQMSQLYTPDIISRYQNANKSDNAPHVFAIANDAYKSMKKELKSQSIIVSGESGAGKTVSAKYIMRFFASVHTEGTSFDTTEIEKQILATNPIMESFGNAKTTRNDNSSRFGKYLKLFFDENHIICGAKIQIYLLERSRLVYQAKNERNYHIFYQLIQGLDDQLKAELALTKCEDFNYLSKGGVFEIDEVNDANEFKITCDALKIIGIDEHMQFELFKILAALLHIGNINIENSRNEAVLSADDLHLCYAANLLGVDKLEFGKWITKKKIAIRSDNIASSLKYHEAIVARDSVSKYIYSLLFDWLVSYINSDLSYSEIESNPLFIGVLDIYGFEHFDTNSFEQFCINYANEKLQQEFAHHVFKLQQEEYIKEGIEWSFIKYSDNQPCIDVIESREGILSLLDEQCKLPSGSDKIWAEKMFHSLTHPPHNKVFKKARFGNEKFIVSHYALDVNYEVDGFLEKNRDTVSDAQNEVLKATKNEFFHEIIASSAKDITDTPIHEKRRSLQNRNRKPTLSHIFKKSLNELMNTIHTTSAHYIRCIKPNEAKAAWEFTNSMVLSQLRACGVLETIRISLVGFPSKYSYKEFLSRFSILLSHEDLSNLKNDKIKSEDDLKKLSMQLLDKYISNHELFQPGRSKLFFRAGVLGQLEIAKSNKLHEAVIIIQKYLRGYNIRKQWSETLKSIISLQSLIRGTLTRFNFKKELNAVIDIQSICRGRLIRSKIQIEVALITRIQSLIRAKKVYSNLNASIISLVNFQSLLRGYRVRFVIDQEEEYLRKLYINETITNLQSIIRGNTFRGVYFEMVQLKSLEEILRKEEDLKIIEKERRLAEESERIKMEEVSKQLEKDRIESERRDLDNELTQLRKEKRELEELAKRQAEELAKHDLERDFQLEQKDDDLLIFSKSSKPIFNFDTNKNEDEKMNPYVDKAWSLIEPTLLPQKYNKEALLGMRPDTALRREAKSIVQRIKHMADKIDQYQRNTNESRPIDFSRNIKYILTDDVDLLQQAVKRVTYKKPIALSKRSSIISSRSVKGISVDTIGSNSSNSHVNRSYRSGYSDLKEYTNGALTTISLVADLILQNFKIPKNQELYDEKTKKNVGNILLPSRIVVVLLFEMWDNDMLNESVQFLETALSNMMKQLLAIQDRDLVIYNGAYLLSNVNEIKIRISIARSSAMHSISSEKNNSQINRSEYLKMLSIIKRYSDAVFGKMYYHWINSVVKELDKKASNAILFDETAKASKRNSRSSSSYNTYYQYIIKSGSDHSIPELLHILYQTFISMTNSCFEESIMESIIHDLITYIDIISFNEIILQKKHLTFERSLVIKSNIMLILGWCKDHGIPDAPNCMKRVLTLCQILQLKNYGLSDIDHICSLCDFLTRDQVTQIVGAFDKNISRDDTSSIISSVDSRASYLISINEDLFENKILNTTYK